MRKTSPPLLISLKPNYADLVFRGLKTAELRRRMSEHVVNLLNTHEQEETVPKQGQIAMTFDAIFEVDVFIEILRGPEVYEVDAGIDAADSVNTSETLDDTDRVPVNVVVDEVVAVLKVLTLADAVRGDEKINLALLGHGRNLATVFGPRREVGENLVVGTMAESGAGVAAAADERHLDTEFIVRPPPASETRRGMSFAKAATSASWMTS